MLLLACSTYLLESYAFACLLYLPTRIQRLFASVCRISWHKASEDEPGDGDRGLVSPMRLTSGDEEATLPFPNRELRIRNFRRRRISMLCLLCFALLTRILSFAADRSSCLEKLRRARAHKETCTCSSASALGTCARQPLRCAPVRSVSTESVTSAPLL